jgi:16S rRNA processing protein RimM
MTEAARRLVVGRLRKPHGLKGDVAVFPLTSEPDRVFAPGQSLWLVDLAGEVVAGPVQVARSRGYHRQWLMAFRQWDSRSAVERWAGPSGGRGRGADAPQDDEVYLDELPGFAVRDAAGQALGLVTACYDLPAGLTIEVQGPKREFLLPYKKQYVKQVDRAGRTLVVEVPEGLLDL